MTRDAIIALADDLTKLAAAGTEHAGSARLTRHLPDLSGELADSVNRALHADDDERPAPLLEALSGALHARATLADAGVRGSLDRVEEAGSWASPMPAEQLYLLVPETRAFSKKVKPEVQVETIEANSRLGTIADLRLLQIFLKHLADKKADALVPEAVAKDALPTFGTQVLPELWPSLAPDNRTFTAAYRIDIQATLRKLTEKTGKKGGADRSGSVTKAVEKILENSAETGGGIGPESLPLLKAALKYAPEQPFRRKIADTLANMGDVGRQALPDLIDAFENMGLTRDYHLIRPLAALGNASDEVADVLMRALEDRDGTVRIVAAFNLGQLAEGPAMRGLDLLERLADTDPEPKVREVATRMVNKLRARLEPEDPEDDDAEEIDGVGDEVRTA